MHYSSQQDLLQTSISLQLDNLVYITTKCVLRLNCKIVLTLVFPCPISTGFICRSFRWDFWKRNIWDEGLNVLEPVSNNKNLDRFIIALHDGCTYHN